MNQFSLSSEAARSPLSPLPPKKVRDLPRTFLLDRLADYYGTRPPAEIVEGDYALWECAETGLQFAWPPQPGSRRFYEWVSSFASYYPGIRWEYGEVKRLLAESGVASENHFKLLDVGCGKGDFLHGLDSLPNDKKFALDLNEPAIAECRRRGFPAFCGTMETALAAGFLKPGSFPVVTSFHCLEHVDQPVEFVRSLLAAVAPGGRLLLSTPYSPLSFEADWFDILNHPPHHMTRWNLAAYHKLAKLVQARMRYFVPACFPGPFKRAVRNFRLLHHGPIAVVTKARLLKDILRRLPEFWRSYQKQRQRQRQSIVANDILVEFTIA